MTVKEIVETYNVRLASGGRLGIYNSRRVDADNALEMIKARKPEIVAYLHAQVEAAAEAAAQRQAKINAIEGLAQLRAALRADAEYYDAFNRMMDDEYNDGARPPKKPEVSPSEVAAKYPRAAAYIKAESWSYAAHYAKAAAGRKALEKIIDGGDHESAINAMGKEWSAHCAEHIWD